MLTKVKAYPMDETVDQWTVDVINRPYPSGSHWPGERCEIRNIDGLGAVAAAINTSPLGSIDGESFIGSSVGKRNIVLTVGFTPDWVDYTPGELRKELNRYFTPKSLINLEFETLEFAPMVIPGYVESNEPNMFSEDPEHIISVICPDPYFRSLDPVVLTGNISTVAPEWDPRYPNIYGNIPIDYEGDVPTGFVLQVRGSASAGVQPNWVRVSVNDPLENFVEISGEDTDLVFGSNQGLELSTIPRDKHVHGIEWTGAEWIFLSNMLNRALIFDYNDRDSRWPIISPGTGITLLSNHNSKVGWSSGFGPNPTYRLEYYTRLASL